MRVLANPLLGNAICYFQMQTFCSNISRPPMPETPQYLELSGALSVSRRCLTIPTCRTGEGWDLGAVIYGCRGSAGLFPSLGVIENPETKTNASRTTIPPFTARATGILRPTFFLPAKGRLINHRDPGHLHTYWEYAAEVPTIPTPMFLDS